MSTFVKALLVLNLLLAGTYLGSLVHAQRPPETDATGAAYLRVNINPTDVAPAVNINPYETVPKVEITRLPEIRLQTATSGCQSRQGFRTGIGRSISGPLMITYLHLPQMTTATLSDATATYSMNLGAAGQITTAIFLQSSQTLEFDSDIMYSGCRPD
ncbi:MAG TPA: hypothetical protein VER98_07345 [Terriglobia bacterium]|nr:hypothetical protein [Terriglobia bacterium]